MPSTWLGGGVCERAVPSTHDAVGAEGGGVDGAGVE